MVDIAGQRFGKLVAVQPTGQRNSYGKPIWLCQCDCGQSCEVAYNLLQQKRTTSCGCIRKAKDLTGMKFNRLLVLGKDEEAKPHQDKWRCLCDCGKTTSVLRRQLAEGKTRSCGCIRMEWLRTGRTHDLTGRKFGKLTALERVDTEGQATWRCRCDCGNEIRILANRLLTGNTKSCGCGKTGWVAETGDVHGLSHTPEHRIWTGMMSRCYNPKSPQYSDYGGRGIIVEESWHQFINFYNDMGERPPEMSIERVDVNGNYGKDNCVWADRKTQSRNRRSTVMLTFRGETLPLVAWAERIGIAPATLSQRIRNGWSVEEALSTTEKCRRRSVKREIKDPKRRQRYEAGKALKAAVKAGRLVRPPHCQHPGCTETRVEGHHHNGYEPEHHLDVVWVCREHHPRDDSVRIEAFGENLTLTEWSKKYGVKGYTIQNRIKMGWKPEDAVSVPSGHRSGGRRKKN